MWSIHEMVSGIHEVGVYAREMNNPNYETTFDGVNYEL